MSSTQKMLEVADIHTYYGESQMLYGVSLEVGMGRTVAILGRNGMANQLLSAQS